MQQIRAFWHRGLVGKLIVGGTALIGGLLLCCGRACDHWAEIHKPATGTQPSTTTVAIAAATIVPRAVLRLSPPSYPHTPQHPPPRHRRPPRRRQAPRADKTPAPRRRSPRPPRHHSRRRAGSGLSDRETGHRIGDALNTIGTLAQITQMECIVGKLSMVGQAVRVQLARRRSQSSPFHRRSRS